MRLALLHGADLGLFALQTLDSYPQSLKQSAQLFDQLLRRDSLAELAWICKEVRITYVLLPLLPVPCHRLLRGSSFVFDSEKSNPALATAMSCVRHRLFCVSRLAPKSLPSARNQVRALRAV